MCPQNTFACSSLPYAWSMAYGSSRRRDVVRSAKSLVNPDFVRAVGRTAANWSFTAAVPVPVVAAESLVDEACEIRLEVGSGQFGETPLPDLVALCLLVAQAKPAVSFEFGTFTGLGTLHIVLNAPMGIVHTLDLQEVERTSLPGLEWETSIEQSTVGSIYLAHDEVSVRVQQHWGDSRQFDTSILSGKVDFIFIDAAHSYEYVKSDTAKAIEMGAPGATIVWHDYSRACPDVQRVVAEQVPKYAPITIAGTSIVLMRLP